MILIGSRAARVWDPAFRTPQDWDVVASLGEIAQWAERQGARLHALVPSSDHKLTARLADGTSIEFEDADALPSARRLARMDHPGTADFLGEAARVPAPSTLYALKCSHIWWPIHWRKNIADLHALKRLAGDTLTGEDDALLLERRAETQARVRLRTPSLAMDNSAFFRQSRLAVPEIYPHDAYHWAVAYEDAPIFTRIKRDPSRATCARDLFERLTLIQRLRCVREETMVIALERYIVPGRLSDPVEAYLRALERVATTLTSGWFRDFAIDHWPELNTPDVDYVRLFHDRLAWALERSSANLTMETV